MAAMLSAHAQEADLSAPPQSLEDDSSVLSSAQLAKVYRMDQRGKNGIKVVAIGATAAAGGAAVGVLRGNYLQHNPALYTMTGGLLAGLWATG
jgi:hypothetical protein